MFWLPLESSVGWRAGTAATREETAPGWSAEAGARTLPRARRRRIGRRRPPGETHRDGPRTAPVPAALRRDASSSGRTLDQPAIDQAIASDEPEVLVARTLLPTELPLLSAGALVVETGGALDHVAAQARERGIPAVVGAAGATAALRDGDQVLVDGDAGVVARID